jgi:hypothetical protein
MTMYLASLDHSPTEQLVNDETWHTSALILSQGGEYFELATDIAEKIGGKGARLKKWSARGARNYRSRFEQALLSTINRYPVHVRVISAQGSTIASFAHYMLAELGLSDLVQSIEKANNKRYLRFGPTKQEIYYDVPERQAWPLIFLCHFLVRKHRELLLLIQQREPEIEWVDWQLSPNKFPGDIDGPMHRAFSGTMQGAAQARLVLGNIRISTYLDPSTDALADNVSGLFASRIKEGRWELGATPSPGKGASVLWEVWPSGMNSPSS